LSTSDARWVRPATVRSSSTSTRIVKRKGHLAVDGARAIAVRYRGIQIDGGFLVWLDPAQPVDQIGSMRLVGLGTLARYMPGGFRMERVFPAVAVDTEEPPLWRLMRACEDWEARTGIFRGFWPAFVLTGAGPPLFPVSQHVEQIPLTAMVDGPVRPKITVEFRDPELTRDDLIQVHRSLRRHFGTTDQRRLSADDVKFLQRVGATARALAAKDPTRKDLRGPRTDFEIEFWRPYRKRYRVSPTVQGLGMRWRAAAPPPARH
jgi:hypothetical protein